MEGFQIARLRRVDGGAQVRSGNRRNQPRFGRDSNRKEDKLQSCRSRMTLHRPGG